MAREGHDPPRDEDAPCHVSIVPVKVKSWSSDARCHVLRTVAYRAVGTCGWRGPSRPTWAEARYDRVEHLAE